MRRFNSTGSRLAHKVLTATILEQIFEIEFLVQYMQCPDCTRLAAKNTWRALVQVRQKVQHKRTFLFLEQLILKHGAHKDTISVKEVKDGLDFFYSQKSHAVKMTEFLTGSVPVRWVFTLSIFWVILIILFYSARSKASEQLLSADTHTNTANFKYTFSVEIAPICKDDLVCIPPKQARSLGNISPLTVCTRVGNSIHLLDPQTLQLCDVTALVYWRSSFFSLASVTDLVEFTVLDIEPSGPTKGKLVLADAQVALSGAFRSSGNNGDDVEMDHELASSTNQIFHTRTHLGAILQPGDAVMGYHLTNANFNSDDFAQLHSDRIPDVILVKKAYPNRRKKNKTRGWKLRSIAKEVGEEGETSGARGVVGRMGGRDNKKVDLDYELFLRDLEEDLEMRGAVNLYKTQKDGAAETAEIAARLAGGKQRAKGQLDPDVQMADGAQEEDEEEEADFPEIKLDELLEEFDEMTLQDDEIQS